MAREAIKQSVRFDIFNRDWFRCKYCGKSPEQGVKLQVDHIIPVAKGGWNEVENLVTACWDCNIGKSKKLIWNKINNRDLKQETKDMQEQIKVLNEYYKFLKQKNKLSNAQNSIETFISISWSNPTECRHKDITTMIKKYWMEIAVKAREIFLESNKDEARYFFWICKNLNYECTDPYYKDKLQFYYDYIKYYDDTTQYKNKDFILTYNRDAIQYYLDHYWRDIWGKRYNVGDSSYKKEADLTDYQYWKLIINNLKDKKTDLYSNVE